MFKIIYSIVFIVMIAIQAGSCKKYLDKKSNATLVTPSTLPDLQGLLDDNPSMNLRVTPSFGEASTDDFFLLYPTYLALQEREKYVYRWMPFDYIYSNDWSFGYLPVYNSNLVLETIETIPRTTKNDQQWDNVKGSALFFRSYSFLNLCWVYAKAWDASTAATDLGIVLKTKTDFNIPSVRASVKDCYETIIQDAKTAVGLLPENPLHVMRPGRAAAYGLLARAYLSMRMYDSARKYADRCLSIRSDLMDFNNSPFIIPAGNPSVKAYNPETIFYTEMNGALSLVSRNTALVDTVLVTSYADNDLRKQVYFLNTSGYKSFKGSYAQRSDIPFSGIATDEVYLTRAECAARAADLEEALADLNTVLKKRWKQGSFIPFTAATQAEAIQLVLTERRKELLMRGLRWMDIKRLNKEGANIIPRRIINGESFMLPPNDPRYALPLPSDIILLTNMPQN